MKRLRTPVGAVGLVVLLVVAGLGPARAQDHEELTPVQAELAQAVTLYQAGNYEKALAAIQEFLKKNKFSALLPEAIYYEGWCFWSLKRYDEALASFTRLRQQYPQVPLAKEAALRVAECYRAKEKFDEALKEYRQFQKDNPKHELVYQAMVGEADILRRMNDLAGSKALLQRALALMNRNSPSWLDAQFLLGQVLNDLKDFGAAQAIFKQIAAERANPRSLEGLFLAAETMFDNQRYTEAIGYYKRIQSKSAIIAALQAEIAALEARRGEFLRQDNLAAYQAARARLQQTLEKFQAKTDLRPAALFRIGNCYLTLGRPEEASVVYRQFLRLYPNDPLAEQVQFGLIQALTERRQLAEVEEQKKAFEAKYPGSKLLTAAEFMQAESLLARQDYERAIASYQKYISTSKDAELIETARLRIALATQAQRKLAEAAQLFQEFIKQYPQSKLLPDALFRLARTYYEMAQEAGKTGPSDAARAHLAQAAEVLEQLRTQFPQSTLLPDTFFQLGYMYSLLAAYDPANCDKAIAVFQEFLQRWPEHTATDGTLLAPEAMYQVARNQALRGLFDQAAATYQQLVEKYSTAPIAPYAAFEIASVYAGAKQPAKIIEALRRYVERYPDHVKAGDALYSIGWTLEQDQKIDEALKAYQDLVDRAAARAENLPDEFRNAAIAAQIRIATLLTDRDEVDAAINGCEEFLNKFAHDPVAARTMIAQITTFYRKAKRTAAAYARFDQIASRFVQNAAVRHAAATAEIELALSERDYARANPAVQRLLADPQRAELPAASLAALGTVFLKTDRYREALDIYQQMQDRFGTDPRYAAFATLGMAQAQLGLRNLDAADKLFQALLAQPDTPLSARTEAELGQAKVLLAKAAGRSAEDPLNQKAVELLTRVLSGGKGDLAGEAGYLLGKFFFEQRGHPVKGKDNCKTALAYFLRVALLTGGPMGEEAAFRAAECQECMGNTAAARNAYAAYLRRFPDGAFAKEAKARLASLTPPKP